MPGSATRVEVSVTIPEGYTLKRIFALLEEKEVCSADVLWETAATYDFDSENDGCVTVRERDSMEQVRLPIAELESWIAQRIEF